MDFQIKRNDTSPAIEYYLIDDDGNRKDITGASVKFHMETYDEEVVVDSDADIIEATEGHVRYAWSPEDTDTLGAYRAEFEATYDNGRVETFPNRGYIFVRINRDVK